MQHQHIFMLEGPDGAGKTTLAKALSRLTNIPYYKPSVSGFELERKTDLITNGGGFAVIDYLEQTGQSVIFDRNYASEYAYNMALYGKANLQGILDLDRRYAALGAIFVECAETIPGVAVPDVTEGQLKKVIELYNIFFDMTTCTIVESEYIPGEEPHVRAWRLLEELAERQLYKLVVHI